MGLRNKLGFWKNLNKNDETYVYYFDRLKELAISSFKWKNLPDTVDERFLELLLFEFGSCVFFKDDVLGHLALQYTVHGPLDVYRVPTGRRAFAVTGYNKVLDNTNSVIIFNNMLKTSPLMAVNHFARKLYNIDRTVDINVKAQKTPVALLCDENEKLSVEQVYSQYDGNSPFIFGSKSLDLKTALTAVPTLAPFVADRLSDLKSGVWTEALEYFGISGSLSEKRERLIVSEVEASMGGSTSSKISRLEMREKACEQINKMFGLNVSVEYRVDVEKWENMERTAEIENKRMYGNNNDNNNNENKEKEEKK